jgi:hypothetical protein
MKEYANVNMAYIGKIANHVDTVDESLVLVA